MCRATTGNLCVFPFTYKGMEYDNCTTIDNYAVPWCYTDLENGLTGNCGETCPRPGWTRCMKFDYDDDQTFLQLEDV